jgi:hypothetical protein
VSDLDEDPRHRIAVSDLDEDPRHRIVIDGVAYSGKKLAVYAYALALKVSVEAAALVAVYMDLLVLYDVSVFPPQRATLRATLFGPRNERCA